MFFLSQGGNPITQLDTKMTNSEKTIRFFELTGTEIKTEVLTVIAKHYGITNEEAFEEVTNSEAEHLCDYIVGPMRSHVHKFMVGHDIF
jgi:hypothetical protein